MNDEAFPHGALHTGWLFSLLLPGHLKAGKLAVCYPCLPPYFPTLCHCALYMLFCDVPSCIKQPRSCDSVAVLFLKLS
jgi:hypothetical protein